MRPAGPLFLSVENSRTLSPALIEAESSYQSPPSRSYPRDALRRIADAVGSPSMTHGIPRETLDGGLGRPRALALRFFGCQSLRHLRSRRILGTTQSRRSEEHTSELQSLAYLVCRLLLEKKKNTKLYIITPNY